MEARNQQKEKCLRRTYSKQSEDLKEEASGEKPVLFMFANVFLCLCTEEEMFGIILIFLFDFLMNGKFN